MIQDYQLGGSILPYSSLFNGLALLLVFALLVFAGIFYVEGNRFMSSVLVFFVFAIACGIWYLKKRRASPRKSP